MTKKLLTLFLHEKKNIFDKVNFETVNKKTRATTQTKKNNSLTQSIKINKRLKLSSRWFFSLNFGKSFFSFCQREMSFNHGHGSRVFS